MIENDNFTLNVPINPVSFGVVSTLLLREIHKLNLNPSIFPIGNVDLSTNTKLPPEFVQWLQNNINKAFRTHKRDLHKVFKLWHFSGGLEAVGNHQTLLSFYECDSPTPEELNIIKNNKKVIVTNEYTKNILNTLGCDNVVKVPLAFDKYNFYKNDKQYFNDGRISFLLPGKLELTRKRTAKVVQTWIKKFGGNKKYFLNCAVHNGFIHPDQLKGLYNQILEGKPCPNVQFLDYMPNNEMFNDALNAHEIIIGMGTEGWNLPLFFGMCLQKHAIALNVAGHKEFCNSENAVLVSPCGKIPIFDQMFFHQGQPFNQGSCFDFDPDEFISACEITIKRVESNPQNVAGLKLQDEFSSEKFAQNILKEM